MPSGFNQVFHSRILSVLNLITPQLLYVKAVVRKCFNPKNSAIILHIHMFTAYIMYIAIEAI
jgi:hypothetical protein